VWESATGREVSRLAVLPGSRREDWLLQFSPEGRWIYSGEESRLNAWEAPTGIGPRGSASAALPVASSPSRANLARMVPGRWQHSPGRPAETTFRPDGAILSDGHKDGSWTLDGSTLTLTWPNPQAPGGAWIDRCELSADGLRYRGRNQVGGQ